MCVCWYAYVISFNILSIEKSFKQLPFLSACRGVYSHNGESMVSKAWLWKVYMGYVTDCKAWKLLLTKKQTREKCVDNIRIRNIHHDWINIVKVTFSAMPSRFGWCKHTSFSIDVYVKTLRTCCIERTTNIHLALLEGNHPVKWSTHMASNTLFEI